MLARIGRVQIAARFGYEFEYIDQLDALDLADIYGVMHGEAKVQEHFAEKAKNKRR